MLPSPSKPRSRCAMKVLAVAALATVSLASRAASADEVAATWNAENDGTWTYAPAWSTNPNYPDNTMGTTYDAVLGGTGGNQYQVTLDSDITINSLSVSSDDAILDQVDGTFQAGTINLSAGSYLMEAGTLSNSTLNLSGDGTFLAENYSGGTLTNVTLNNGTLTTSGGGVTTLNNVSVTGGDLVTGPESVVYQQGTLAISSTNVYLGGDAQFCFDGQSRTIDNYTFYGLQSGGNAICVGGPTTSGSITLTLGSHVTIFDGNSITNFTPGDGSGVVNNGLIDADNSVGSEIAITTDNFTNNTLAEATNGGYLQVGTSYNANGDPTSWMNYGTLSAGAGGSTLDLEGNWHNLGTIVAADSNEVIMLGGSFATADIGTLNANGATVYISGSVNNNNATINIPAFGGVTELYGGAISGGTLNVGSGNLPVISGTVDNLHVTNGGLEVQSSLEILDQLTIDNKTLVLDADSSLFFSSQVQSVDNLNIQTSGYAYLYAAIPYDYTDPVSLTLGKGVIVHDGAQVEGTGGSTVTNQGDFLADNSASSQNTTPGILIDVTNFNNSGLLEASNGGTINIGMTSYSGAVSTVNFTNSGVLLVQNGTIASTSTLSL
jgi:hypothetical protein